LPQPIAKDARASAMSARAKSLRIVCTFTSSHAATPGIRRERPCSFFSVFKLGTQKKTPLCGKRCRAGSVLAHCGSDRGQSVRARQEHAPSLKSEPQARHEAPACQPVCGRRPAPEVLTTHCRAGL
jgi:hypothetical protein